MSRVRALSADEQARRLAFVRERALHDEVMLLKEAQRRGEQIGLEKGLQEGQQIGLEQGQQIGLEKGEQIGLEKGQQIGLEKGRREAAMETARGLMELGVLGDGQIALVTGLSAEEVEALRAGDRH